MKHIRSETKKCPPPGGSETVHPVIASRYFGLVWDFTFKIKNKKPNHKIGEKYINSLLQVVTKGLYKEYTYAKIKANRALAVSLSLNKPLLIDEAKKSIILLENKIGKDEKPGTWGFSYDLLYANKKLLKNNELDEIIKKLEQRMTSLHSIDPWACKGAVTRLADYYNRNHRSEDLRRVLLILSESYLSHAKSASPIQASGYIEELYKIFAQYKLNHEANELLIKLRELQKKTTNEYKKIGASVDIPNTKIKKFINLVLKGNEEQMFIRILYANLPTLEATEKDLLLSSNDHPLMFLISRSIVDSNGRTIAKVGPIDKDFEGQRALHFSQYLKFNSIGLHFILKESIKREILTEKKLMNFLRNSCIINNERFPIIEQGIKAFLDKNYLISVHLLIPQFEEAVRNLVEINGENILNYKDGSFQLKTFDQLLRDTIVLETLGADFSYYYRILFTDSRGWNLRNNIAHGLLNPNEIDEQVNEQLVHALLVLGMIRWKTEQTNN